MEKGDKTRVTKNSGLTAAAIRTLEDDTWLNDEVINVYIQHAIDRKLEQVGHSKGKTPRYWTLNSNWWETVESNKWSQEEGFDKVMKWSKRAKVGGANLLEVEQLFIPINRGSHWLLLVISGTQRKVTLLNSITGAGLPSRDAFRAVRKYLALELGEKYVAGEWRMADGGSPQQRNGSDCGVFVCFNALALMLDLEPKKAFGAADMSAGRRQVAATLINEGFRGELDLF
ncbi:cysteine proteinase [Rhizodiscina lignyota]|uniref:Cysteine proteinase n=1 Tax=Rhizodiscina lignyota TaxID=1504668 RepID=A0A9P4IS59_9PEZI|nr:cysteine proteinase [Rhizodiscina lignyota]